jgi:hypothetical protein
MICHSIVLGPDVGRIVNLIQAPPSLFHSSDYTRSFSLSQHTPGECRTVVVDIVPGTERTIGDQMNDRVITMGTRFRVPIVEDKIIGRPMAMTEIGLAHVILGMIETLRTEDQDKAPRTVLPPLVRLAMGPVVEAEDIQDVAVVVSKTVSH